MVLQSTCEIGVWTTINIQSSKDCACLFELGSRDFCELETITHRSPCKVITMCIYLSGRRERVDTYELSEHVQYHVLPNRYAFLML
uniref:GekBS064P n=1 Tax=Gekko japonicus TaxID=146911 RepID=Q5I1E2_GEKJA|nr:GekBS064P [Gekko japonicus]